MAVATEPIAVKPFVGILVSRPALLSWVTPALTQRLGPVHLQSALWPFDFTSYYEPEMGPRLQRQFLGFEQLMDPGRLAELKLFTNRLEDECAQRWPGDYPRVINLDPGYLSLAQVVLATTKNYTHRIYIGQKIYAEVTLYYQKGAYQPWPWTYPDYRTTHYRAFFRNLRQLYRHQLRTP